jgi:GntR family transcriptional regulator
MITIELQDRTQNPIYVQVRQQIETQISNKTATSGESLPSPAALGQKLSVDKGEIQRAYYELEQLGLITRHTGKDFLGKPKIEYRVK